MKETAVKGGHGRSLMNKMPKPMKKKLDRQVDKKRRQEGKKIIRES